MKLLLIIAAIFLSLFSCSIHGQENKKEEKIITGAARVNNYIPAIKGKRIGIISNHTSLVNGVHLVDTLLALDMNVIKIFSPEHGFRGDVDAGASIGNYLDQKTGLPVISLYGKHHQPTGKDLENLDILIFDIQDVGVRFYTYLSTLHYVMESCAKHDVPLLILDRPNPNGHYVDGQILDTIYRSFVGIHPVPVVYGLTIGEFAGMINGEKWLDNGRECNVSVIPCLNYTHDSLYQLPVNPSPNLPNMHSVYLYPSLGLFEGTVMSVGRGTGFPFQVFGHPAMLHVNFTFVPRSIPGKSTYPKHEGELCRGVNLMDIPLDSLKSLKKINPTWIIEAYRKTEVNDFFNSFFYNLSGTSELKAQIINDVPVDKIRLSWQEDIHQYMKTRNKYLLYPDFNKGVYLQEN